MILARILLTSAIALPLMSASVSPAPQPPVVGKVFMRVDEALKLAFPDCEVDRGTVYLTEDQRKRAKDLAKFDIPLRIFHPYKAMKDGKHIGTAYFDTHKVRTMNESVMIVVTPDDKISRVEILSFSEPVEYVPSGKWYGQFTDKKLNDDLSLKRKIRGMTGATLTARATTKCARRVLALHQAIKPKKKSGEKKKNEK